MGGDKPDEVLDALKAAAEGLEENITLLTLALERMVRIREQRLSGMTYSEMVDHSDLPHLVEIFRTSLHVLERHGHRLRVAGVRTLHAEGLSIDRISELFGVSRQRVSALLRSRPGDSAPL
jgi:hypothetical protein